MVRIYNYNNNVVYNVILIGRDIMSTANELLEIAKNELVNLKPGEMFLVRDLFKGYEWNRISRSNRLLLGTLFLNFIKNIDIDIVVIEKTSSGQQRYQKNIKMNVAKGI